jgi:hypothetical protein
MISSEHLRCALEKRGLGRGRMRGQAEDGSIAIWVYEQYGYADMIDVDMRSVVVRSFPGLSSTSSLLLTH